MWHICSLDSHDPTYLSADEFHSDYPVHMAGGLAQYASCCQLHNHQNHHGIRKTQIDLSDSRTSFLTCSCRYWLVQADKCTIRSFQPRKKFKTRRS
ncbi:uncharacterized protein LAESUDRAFT_504018 [Laetiporus sulphureus 93-53]|uniref:Uncharacterized protein n=1 Tax=Laetiporus sulphureus 93-53 TaxID=1314785 RepID=A0A165FU87_9APHY|nr:uncharacterized protein LAESUDRAFT_504018 [Laetiporus sulphureus 93-53]KZT09417.1 hypothetical protein LAESUDRAFT_504018 [Laetiporus sulphureus 93-53]